jgi:hypothetical protein
MIQSEIQSKKILPELFDTGKSVKLICSDGKLDMKQNGNTTIHNFCLGADKLISIFEGGFSSLFERENTLRKAESH